MRIFSLEFIKESLNVEQLHFFPAKKGNMFKLGKFLGSFVVNSRHAFKVVESLLKKINFELGYFWNYDPHGVIAQRREKIKSSTYEHEYRPQIEWKANHDSWPMDTEIETEPL